MQLSTLNNIQRLLTTGVGVNKTVVSVALGTAIAYALPIPAEAQRNNGNGHYIRQHFTSVDTFLSELNEVYLIEIQTALDVARTLWQIRYDSVHLASERISELATKANPIRDYLSGFSLDDDQIQQVLATGVVLAEQLCATDLCKSTDTVRG